MGGPHRDDLEAAHERIKQLEETVAELRGGDAKQEPKEPAPAETPGQADRRATRAAFGCLPPLLLSLILGPIVFGGRACIACNARETDAALAAINRCPAAKEALGDDIGWSVVGCSNYESGTGGDPINGGCHSSASYVSPVAGTKGRGSYDFSTVSPARAEPRFTGGVLTTSEGQKIYVKADGTCQAPERDQRDPLKAAP